MTGGFHIRVEHLKLIAASHVRNSLRSGAGVIFLVLSMLVGLILAGIAVFPVEAAMKFSEKLGGQQETAAQVFDKAIHKWGPSVLDTVVGATPAQAHHLLVDKPALISLFLVLLIIFLPFLAALGGFNQTAGDIGSRGLRYLLLRTERANIYLGRLIGTYLFTLAVITVIILVVGLYVIIKVKFYPAGDVVLWMLQGWFACALFALPWIALYAWISASIPMSFLSLLVAAGGLVFWVILVAVMRGKVDEAGYAIYATPWGFKWWLLDPSAGKMVAGIAVMLAFTGLFTFLGLRTFHRRDM